MESRKFMTYEEIDQQKNAEFINGEELTKVIISCLDEEKQTHQLNKKENGLIVIGIIKGLVKVGILVNPFLAMQLVRKFQE